MEIARRQPQRRDRDRWFIHRALPPLRRRENDWYWMYLIENARTTWDVIEDVVYNAVRTGHPLHHQTPIAICRLAGVTLSLTIAPEFAMTRTLEFLTETPDEQVPI